MKRILSFKFLLLVFCVPAFAQTNEITYQGKLTDTAPSATYDFEFRLCAADTPGDCATTTPPGVLLEIKTRTGVSVSSGVFTVKLDFLAAHFTGADRFLEIMVRRTSGDPWTPLNPRQKITSSPYSLKAATADNSLRLGGELANQYVQTNDSRLSDARMPLPGSNDYIQAQPGPSQQPAVSFNIGGNGTIGGTLSLGTGGTAAAPSMTFSGDTDTGIFRSAADTLNFSTTGISRMRIEPDGKIGINTLATPLAQLEVRDNNPSPSSGYGIRGLANGSTGFRVGVIGETSVLSGTGSSIGVWGLANGPATTNYGVFGSASGGTTNWAGYFDGNTFVGGNLGIGTSPATRLHVSGAGIVRARINSDVNAGMALTLNDQPRWSVATVTGGQFQVFNDALGQNAFWIDSASNNVGIGTTTPASKLDVAGTVNTSAQYNIGGNRMLSASGPFNDGLTGNYPLSNTFAGGSAGSTTTPDPSLASISGKLNSFFGTGAGQVNTTGALNSFFGFQAGASNTVANGNSFFGQSAGSRSTGSSNSFLGRLAGSRNVGGNSNTAVGENADFATNNSTGSSNTLLGSNTRVAVDTSSQTALGSLSKTEAVNSTAIGFRANVTQSNSLVLGSINGVNNCNPPFCDSVNVGIGTTAPSERLHVVGDGLFTGNLTVNGTLNANLPISGTYIQNNPPAQQPANFNINGNGMANIFEAATQFNIGGNRVFSNEGNNNLFAGRGTGNAGSGNAFFGSDAGASATTFSGSNSFFGAGAGFQVVDGSNNAFFGASAGSNSSGSLANANTFVGSSSGSGNATGRSNTLLGFSSNLPIGSGLINAGAVGARAFVTQDNSLVLGSINGVNGATADTNVGIGTTAPSERLHVVGNGLFTGNLTVSGTLNANLPISGNYIQNNSATPQPANFNINGNGTLGGSLGIGTTNPPAKLSVSGNTATAGDNTAFFENAAIGPNLSHVHHGTTGDWFIRSAASVGKVVLQDLGGTVSIGTPLSNNSRLYIEGAGGTEPALYARNLNFAQVSGVGVEGVAQFQPGFGTGGVFTGGNTGVRGLANAESYAGFSYGVHGRASGTNGFKVGVQGISSVFPGTSLGYGVYGLAEGAGSIKYGVYGEALGPGTNWAGYFNGDTHVAGKLSAVTSLGVGVVSPTFKLQVIDSSNTGLRVQTNTAGGTVASFGGSGAFQIDASGVNGGRFHVSENGTIGIGTNAPTDRLQVMGDIRVGTGGINGCLKRFDGTALAGGCSSDIRFKERITAFPSALDKLAHLRPVHFYWRTKEFPEKSFGEGQSYGLIAQEVEGVLPELVSDDQHGYKTVDYSKLPLITIQAIKELRQENDLLKQRASENAQSLNQQLARDRTQQSQIEAQTKQIEDQRKLAESQQRRIEALEKLVCELKPQASVCKEEKR